MYKGTILQEVHHHQRRKQIQNEITTPRISVFLFFFALILLIVAPMAGNCSARVSDNFTAVAYC
jgi:hypothetical protein